MPPTFKPTKTSSKRSAALQKVTNPSSTAPPISSPHPLVDPTEVSQGMSNRFWQTLYPETYRFLTTGKATLENMEKIQQDPALAIVAT